GGTAAVLHGRGVRAGGGVTRRRAPPAPRLLLDVGNSRLKWALWSATAPRAGNFERRGVLALSALRRSDAGLRRLFATLPADTATLACNVAGAGIEALLRRCAARARLPRPQFVRTTARAAGVRNGYAEPWRLG